MGSLFLQWLLWTLLSYDSSALSVLISKGLPGLIFSGWNAHLQTEDRETVLHKQTTSQPRLPVQKRAGTVVWGAIPQAPVWKYGPWLVSGNLGLFHSQNWQEQLTVPKLVVEAMWSVRDTHFPAGSLEFWRVLSQEYLCEQPPIKPRALSLYWVSW